MRFTVYLLRKGARLTKATLRQPQRYEECELIPPEAEGASWRLFLFEGNFRAPRWLKNVQPLFASEPPVALLGRTPGGVLLVQVQGRLFAVTFGVGFHAIGESVKEPDFGLRVAANSIKPDRITSADARGLGKGTRNATSRLSTPGEMFALGLITDEEWIRKFGGEVKLEGFAKTANGADSLQLNIDRFDMQRLPDTLGKALELFDSEEYRELFPFLTYFRRETNKETVAALDDLLSDQMRARDPEVGFALPDEYSMTADQYELSRGDKSRVLMELLTDDVYSVLDELNAWSNPLASITIEAYDMSDGLVTENEPLRSFVVGQVSHEVDGELRRYALTAGVWFRIDQDYVDAVDRFIADRVEDLTADLDLPAWDDAFLRKNVEGQYGEIRYNRWVSQERGYGLLDTDLYRAPRGMRGRDLRPTDSRQDACLREAHGWLGQNEPPPAAGVGLR